MTSSYYLAVDVGTSRTAAATARLAPDGSLLATPFALGRSADSAPSAMFVTGGELLFGDAAERRGLTEPERLVREFKRRIGDDVPIIAGDQRFTPEEVYALMVAWVVDLVSEREARLPNAIAVTVPVAWGQYRTQLVEEALARHGWSSVTLVTEPEAAARHYESTSPLPAARALAVYDLGGGTFDAIVLRTDAAGTVQSAGSQVGLDDIGGSDFDDAVLRHTLTAAGVAPESLGADERMALAALRRECVDAKESLSFDSEVVIPVLLGSGHGTVRLTRDEFESMIDQRITRTTDALAEALESAGVDTDEVESILLTGGSSRIPHIAQVLSERFDRPIAIDADPKAIIALGAVRVLSDHASGPAPAAVPAVIPAAASAIVPVIAAAAVEKAATKKTVTAKKTDVAKPLPDRGDAKGRKWRLPTFAYLSAGSLVLGIGLVVATTTAMSSSGMPVAQTDSAAFINHLLSAGLSAGTPDSASAAELPAAAVAAPQPVEQAETVSDTQQAPAPTPNKVVPRRAGPKAATAVRTTPTPTSGSTSATQNSSSGSTSAASGAGSGAGGGAASGGSTTTESTPSQEPSSTPSPTQDPTTEPTTEPTTTPTPDPTPEPTTEPTPDPTPEPTTEPTTDPTPDPTPSETQSSEPVADTESTPAPTDPTPSPTPTIE